jgi:uncharacterized protein
MRWFMLVRLQELTRRRSLHGAMVATSTWRCEVARSRKRRPKARETAAISGPVHSRRRSWLRVLTGVSAALFATWLVSSNLPGRASPAGRAAMADLDIWQLSPEELEQRIEGQLERGEPATLTWDVLRGMNYRTGESSVLLQRLDRQRVRLPGFVVPLEDYEEEFREFLLVPWSGACIHTPPPPPNQMVHALMVPGTVARTPWWEPVWVEGTLHVVPTNSPYGVVSFQLEGHEVVPLEG